MVFVVLADEGLSLINVKQERKGHDSYGTRLYNGDFFLSNCLFGVPIFTARDAGEMREALEKSFSAKGPAIIEAVIDGSEYGELIARRYK